MNIDYFEKFLNKEIQEKEVNNEVWIYTRVSSKDQESNSSLQNQKEYAEKYAKNNGLVITKGFGHTYESARGDFTRKEFKKLTDELRSTKNKPYAILIYIMSRFSRSGGNSIGLVNEFREIGVHIIETQSGVGTQTEMGEFQIYQKLLEARKENMDRLKSTIPGLKRFVENGNYLGYAPKGFTLYGTRTVDFRYRAEKQRMVINEDGKLIKKAWDWKANGERDFIIVKKLEKLGLIIPKQTLSSIWRNPTYCGISTNKLLDKPIKGNWSAIISEKKFMKVQRILDQYKSGYKIERTNNERPLTKHIHCSECNKPLTGYKIKKKELNYYRCQTCRGVSINANDTKRSINKGAHELYSELLSTYKLQNILVEPFRKVLKEIFTQMGGENNSIREALKKKLKEHEIKREKLADKFIDDLIDKEIYNKLRGKIYKQIIEIKRELNESENKISNLDKFINKTIDFSQNINKYWDLGDLESRIKLQNLMFPEGVVLDVEKRQYLTKKTNLIFSAIKDLTRITEGQKKDELVFLTNPSSLVAGKGFEPMTFGL